MKLISRISFIVAAALVLNSCYYDAYYEIDEITEDVSYSVDIQALWDAGCVTCHDGNEPPDLRPDTGYDDLLNNGWVVPFDAENSILYQSLLGTDGVSLMPPGAQWPLANINLVRDWINQGAQDN